MLKGFKDFILKGNVIDLATAVIIGTAFTAIVTAFTKGIVQPIINTIPWSPDKAAGLGFTIVSGKSSTFVDIGSVITAVVNFIIIAAVVYFVIILPYNKLAELGGFDKKAEVTEVDLLTEIRDLLDSKPALAAATVAAVQATPPAASAPYPTPNPAPGNYPPPGNYPSGSQLPDDLSDGPGRHSR
ncbi:MAG: large conductance mechanosensitive channel protein MscL [Gordonia sp. (in: high G+C Gram-positive bacteria)]